VAPSDGSVLSVCIYKKKYHSDVQSGILPSHLKQIAILMYFAEKYASSAFSVEK
jgi:hypothetical protein